MRILIMAKATKWDYSKIKNFPEGGTIQRSGTGLIVIRRKTVYDPEIGRGRDASREYLGRVVDGVFYSRDEYAQKFQKGGVPRRVPLIAPVESLEVPEAFKSLTDEEFGQLLNAEAIDVSVGSTPILHKIAVDLHIMEDLRASFGEPVANAIFSIAAFHISTGNGTARGFGDWRRNRHLPMGVENLDNRDLSRIYAQIGLHPENVKRFMACRVARNKQSKMLLSVDGATIAWGCSDSEKARIGKGKKGQIESRINLAVTFNTSTHQPILYRVLPGNINDCQTVLDLLTRFDEFRLNTPTCAAALDRGYFADENLLVAHETDTKCIFTAKTNIGWIEETIERARVDFIDKKKGTLSVESTLNDGVVQGVTIERRIKVDGKRFAVFVHVFKSDRTASYQRERLYDELNKFECLWESRRHRTKTLRREPLMKYFEVLENGDQPASLVRDQNAIRDALKDAGIFVGVTTWRCTAQECYDFYGYRSDIERVFRSGKSDFNMNVQRTHNDKTMEGKCFVSFVQLALLEELKQRLATDQEKTLKNGRKRVEIAKHTFDADEVISGLQSIAYTRRKSTGSLLCREVIEKQRLMAIACGCRGIFDSQYTY